MDDGNPRKKGIESSQEELKKHIRGNQADGDIPSYVYLLSNACYRIIFLE